MSPQSLSTASLITKYDVPVPRYTSFPTAVQFKPTASQSDFTKQLAALRPHQPISVYIHIPFCHSLCHYCGCHTKIVHAYNPIEKYVGTLLQEIKQAATSIGKPIPVSQIHFGGGSPNYAKTEDIDRILQALEQNFLTSPDTQIAMECDPRLLDEKKKNDYSRLGISRISLGIQDFNYRVQKVINRIQPLKQVQKQIQRMRKAGITEINFDLITGLPEQSLETVQQTLEQVLKLQPSRIAVFPYAHVPWMKKHQKLLERFGLPTTEVRFAMNLLVQTVLTKAGYSPIGVDHYAQKTDSLYQIQKTGHLRRNFQGYTGDINQTVLGFGLSSISQFKDAYFQNTTDGSDYTAAINAQSFPLSRSLQLTADDEIRGKLIERLMCYFDIDFSDFPSIVIPHQELSALEKDGLVSISENRLSITERGKPFVRIVAACFDPYLKKEQHRHGKAI
ncbi:oxygen-independent coproporphyrinogen III oxidase [Porticoccaceae bacterium]|nr:oxygen-independent coproporphyrinogen III oxidase [Porticoccaceae bacterium]